MMNIESSSATLKFIKRFAVISACLFIADFATGSVLEYLYKIQKTGPFSITSNAINNTTADYLVVGSSRAVHHYNSEIFEKSLHATFYNCGKGGTGALYSCAVIAAATRRYSPKMVIIDVLFDEFMEQSKDETASSLMPYFKNPAVKPYIAMNDGLVSFKLLSKTYPFNSKLVDILIGLNKQARPNVQGYIELPRFDNTQGNNIVDTGRHIFEKGKFDSVKFKAFDDLVCTLSQRKIPVLLVISPAAYKCYGPHTIAACQDIVRKYPNCRFIDFTNSAFLFRSEYFWDWYHLNGYGAALFSRQVASYINHNFIVAANK